MSDNIQTTRAQFFRQLHQAGNPFILANVWDVGTAKLLAASGAVALATTSSGHSHTLGRADMGNVSREESIAHAATIVAAAPVPVSADCENGYGHSPQDTAETVRQAITAGLAGCAIEDTMLPDDKPYSIKDAAARIQSAVVAARETADEFIITARADGMMLGHYGLDEAISRLRAFEEVGADVLYAPMPPDMKSLARICDSVSAPVNALVSGQFCQYSITDFARVGVARLSLGGTLARVTHAAVVNAARAMFVDGDFSPLTKAADGEQIESMLAHPFDKS